MDLKKYIKIYDNAVPYKAIGSLIQVANTLDFEEGGVANNKINKKIRSVKITPLSPLSNSMTIVHWHNFLFAIIQRHLNLYNEEFNTSIKDKITSQILNIDILKYNLSDKYNYHWDHFKDIPRTISCILILNNDYEGGNLCFKEPQGQNEFSIENKVARLIMWPSNFLYPHCVKPITKGTRYSVVAWAL